MMEPFLAVSYRRGGSFICLNRLRQNAFSVLRTAKAFWLGTGKFREYGHLSLCFRALWSNIKVIARNNGMGRFVVLAKNGLQLEARAQGEWEWQHRIP